MSTQEELAEKKGLRNNSSISLTQKLYRNIGLDRLNERDVKTTNY